LRILPTRRPLAWNSPLSKAFVLGLAILAGLVVIQLSPFQGMVLVGLLTILIGALLEPFVALATALFLGPLKAYLTAEVPQIPAQIGHLFIALALGSWLARRLSKRDVRLRWSPLALPLLIFLGAILASLWDATGVVAFGVPELIKWVEIALLFFFVSHHLSAGEETPPGTIDTPHASRRLRWLVLAVFGVGLFQAGVGIWQFALRGEGPEHFAILNGDFFRAYGTFEQPNPYAGYLGITATLALGVVTNGMRGRLVNWFATWSKREDATRRTTCLSARQTGILPIYLFAGSAALAMLIALGASWSRGAWLGFGAAILAMTAALPRKTMWGVILAALLVVGGPVLYSSGQLPTSFTARLTSFVQDIRLEDVRGVPINDANYAVIERLAHWQAALSMFRHNLWSGIGFGCYEAVYSRFALINWPIALGHAHNYYLNLVAEAGLIGLVAYGLLWGVIFWQTWQATRRTRGFMRGLAVGLLGVWTHISVHHLLDNLYVNNVHLQIGVLLGILAFIIQQTSETTLIYDQQA
jgi:O-antigen ligase